MEIARRIRVLLADDHAMVRQGLRSVLECYSDLEVIGEAKDGDEAVASAAKLEPTLIVMDINMPKMDGITATRFIKAQNPQTVVLGLSIDVKDYQANAMKQAGAFEVLTKDQAVDELYETIQRAVASVRQVLIMEESQVPEESKSSAKQAPTEPLPIEELKDPER
jgi:DNA-binding NarL/FixJ family response regulator